MARVTKPGGIICHPAARETINHRHHSIGGVVAGDQIPPRTEMAALLAAAGLANISEHLRKVERKYCGRILV